MSKKQYRSLVQALTTKRIEKTVELNSCTNEGRQEIEKFILDQKKAGKDLIEMSLTKDGKRIPIMLQRPFKLSWDSEHLIVTYQDGQIFTTKS